MLARVICVALAALVLCQCATAYDPIALQNHCRDLVRFVSGPGSLEDHLNRWAFYFNDKGDFKVAGGSSYKTKKAWKEAAAAELEDYSTFNHVHLVDEVYVAGDTCYVDAYLSFLAWDGACGPLIFKTKYELGFTPGIDAGKHAKIKSFKSLLDGTAVKISTDSCHPEQQRKNGIKTITKRRDYDDEE